VTKKSETATLSEPDSRELLRSFSIPCVPDELVGSAEAAVAAATKFGYPVVLKLAGSSLAHKSERGLVRLNIASDEAVATATAELLASAQPEDEAVGVLVSPMVGGIREFIAGCYRDASFGPCVMFGLGGVLTEALADACFRLAPLSIFDAMEMLDDLVATRLLGATRGELPVNRESLAQVLVQLGEIICARDEILSIDINPIRIVAGEPLALDALVETRQ